MEPIKVSAKMDAAHAATLLAEVVDGSRPLYVPKGIAFSDSLSVATVVQAVITWGTRPADGILATNFDPQAEGAGADLARNTPLLTAILFADSVLSRDGRDITAAARSLCAFALTEYAADIPPVAGGVRLGTDRAVIAADHVYQLARPRGIYPLRSLDESSRPLYAGAGRGDMLALRGRLPLGHRALGVSGQKPQSWGEKYSATGSAFGMLLFELLQNTDIHATRSVRGGPLRRSVRLLHLRGVSQKREAVLASATGNQHLINFYAKLPVSSGGQVRFLVASVIDSGPGLARTLLRRENIMVPTSHDQERRYFLRAFRMTAGIRTGDPMRGLGLQRAQVFLTALGGYARVRSGRFEVQRDFIRDPFHGRSESERSWWGGVSEPPVREQVTGTAITLIIPIPPEADPESLWEAAAHGG